MKVSFDFDSTLSRIDVQDYAKSLINKNIEVFICTSRYENPDDYIAKGLNHNDLYKVSKLLNISNNNIIFTNFIDKYEYLKDKNFIWHLDDDWIELNLINKYTNIVGISVVGTNKWKHKCNKLLNI